MLNWLVIGIGDIAVKRVIPAILEEPRSALYGVVTRNPEKAEPYGCRVWTEAREAFEDERIDAVYVATPVALHAPLTIAALEADKHVLCEKPMALNYREARQMVGVAAAANRLLGVAYYRRFYPKVERARRLLAEGAIGRPLLAEINCAEWFNAEGGERRWLLDPAMAGGGPLFDIGSHRIDLLNYLFGRPVRACGQLANVVHDNPVEDCATALVEYETGVRGIVDVRWNTRVSRDGFRILGVEGEMELTPLNGPPLVLPGGREEIPNHANVHLPLVKNFVDATLEGAALVSSGETALWTDWVTEQVVRGSPRKSYLE
ncbi:MAG TPA: Gfo/Idh/MocA family oxidoreductase [Bryobacterales bacterium]|nr:Gfo/Idh/MocA family oxidoreductase [Bryobacterales bacterium]